jgi:microcystin-dependent protein
MPRQTTASGFPYYAGGDKPAGHEQQRDLAETIETVGAKFDTGGLLASGVRAGQPIPEPGRRGRFYRGTSQRGALWVDAETEWHPVAVIPIGGVLDWPWPTAPAGPAEWLELLGQSVTKAAFPELFAALGVTAAAMTVPNRSGRTQIGAGSGAGLTPRAVGQVGGAERHTLTAGEIAPHTHPLSGVDSRFPVNGAGAVMMQPTQGRNWSMPWQGGDSNPVNQNAGGQSHNNVQPFNVTRYFVRTR